MKLFNRFRHFFLNLCLGLCLNLCLGLLVFPVAALAGSADSRLIPSPQTHGAFLLEPWQPDAPSIIAFKDPYCPYCIKALTKLDKLKGYNVFMFWSPILGQASQTKVDEIFGCADPVSLSVFAAVINRRQVSCDKALQDKGENRLKQLNEQVVASYDPQSVPSYYFGGQKVHIGALDRFKRRLSTAVKPVQLNWQRYLSLKLPQQPHTGLANMLVFAPGHLRQQQAFLDALKADYRYNWFVADLSCEGRACKDSEQARLSAELRLLLAADGRKQTAFAINGMVLQPERYPGFLSEEIISLASMPAVGVGN
ncbi:thioredoxin fold domain-containing protein [Thalassomonas viridans]|uniref:Thioredoxin fold domain-containing protein n=1 Tax=Thalassomonas viridans TaxID=137584 RepID=A0AAE9Z043_9GAMM|nr:thioredoxin fold domain-containing protein [Thalassomonas viridans]WDE04113.1 thioredoxin fold domain-containing protein [Thalassomonas viridans]